MACWVLKKTDPRSSHWGHHAPWVSAVSREPRGGSRSPDGQLAAGWASARSPGSTLAPDPDLPEWGGGGAGLQLGPSLGTEGPFFAAQQSPCLPRARLQPPSSPADEEDLVPAPTNTRAFCRKAAVRLSNRGGGFKGPEGSRRIGAEQAAGCSL